MSVAAVVLVKDEADVIERTLRHLAEQVDFVIVSDNLSTDGTFELAQELELELRGALTVWRDEEVAYRQAEKTTALALRALELGHQWVVPCDADEWWKAQDGRRLTDWLAGAPRDVQFVKAAIFNHVPTALDPSEPDPVRRIGWRQREALEQRWWKVACRLRPDLTIHQGNHSATTTGTGVTAFGFEIRHFPHRSPAQYVRKIRNGWAAYAATELPESVGTHWRMHGDPSAAGHDERVAEHFVAWFWSPDPHADDTLVYDPVLSPEPLEGVADLNVPGYMTGKWEGPRRA